MNTSQEQSVNPVEQGHISAKIEQMSRSLAQLSSLTPAKTIDQLRSLQKDSDAQFNEVNKQQRKMMDELQNAGDSLLAMDKAKIIQHAVTSQMQEQIQNKLGSAEEYFQREGRRMQERAEKYSHKISDLKIEMVEIESICRERVVRHERESRSRVKVSEREVDKMVGNSNIVLKQQISAQFKKIRGIIEEQSKQRKRDDKKLQGAIEALGISLKSAVQVQQCKQKQGFQHNYHALEQIFALLSEQMCSKY